MRVRILVAVAAACALSELIIITPADASVISYGDGTCVDWRDPDSPGFNCVRWEGPDGFSVMADMYTWIDRNDSFREGFRVLTGTPEEDSTQMAFRRDDAFNLLSLDLTLGDGQEPYGCASPIEVRSSKGGFLLVEPAAGGPDAMCWQYTDQGFDPYPYPWKTTDLSARLKGREWRNIDWFYVGFKPEVLWQNPRPRITGFQVESFRYAAVPEPELSWLLSGSVLATAWRARRRRRNTPHM